MTKNEEQLIEQVTPGLVRPWDGFMRDLNSRLEVGAREYPNSPHSSPFEIIREWQQETLDIAGWGYVLWQRIEDLKADLRQSEIVPQDAIAEEVLERTDCHQCCHLTGHPEGLRLVSRLDLQYCMLCGRPLLWPYRRK